MRRPRLPAKVTRDTVLVAFGMFIILYETVISQTDRPTLLIGAFGLLGLPVFLRQDEAKKPPPDVKQEAAPGTAASEKPGAET